MESNKDLEQAFGYLVESALAQRETSDVLTSVRALLSTLPEVAPLPPEHFTKLITKLVDNTITTNNFSAPATLINEITRLQNVQSLTVKNLIQQHIANKSDEDKGAGFELVANFDKRCATSAFNAGYFYKLAHQYAKAAFCYEKALARDISRPEEVMLNLATVYAENLSQLDKGVQLLKAALDRDAKYLPAIKNLANLYEQQGLQNKAKVMLLQALSIDPYDYSILARLAETYKYTSIDDEILAKILNLLSLNGLPLEAIIDLNYAAAKIYNDCQCYDQAFEHFEKANKANRKITRPYSRLDTSNYIENWKTVCRESAFGLNTVNSPTVGADFNPVFILGMFRSGSTLTEQILAAHSQVKSGGELPYLPEIVGSLGDGYPASLSTTDNKQLQMLAEQYLARLSANGLYEANDCRVITDKRPDNFLHIGLIKQLFPSAKFIYTSRNPLDNCWAIYSLRLAESQNYANDLQDIADYYLQHQELMAFWQAQFPDAIYTVEYDKLVEQPASEIKSLLSFLSLDWESSCLEFYKVKNQVKTASIYQVRQPFYKTSSGRWKNYSQYLTALTDLF